MAAPAGELADEAIDGARRLGRTHFDRSAWQGAHLDLIARFYAEMAQQLTPQGHLAFCGDGESGQERPISSRS